MDEDLRADGGRSMLDGIHEALQSALEHAKVVDMPGVSSKEGLIARILPHLLHLREDTTDDSTLARHLHHLYSTYFTNREGLYDQLTCTAIIECLARKANHVQPASGRLWPEGSWLSRHIPKLSWLSAGEVGNVLGLNAKAYKSRLQRLGYGPVSAPTKDALDEIWHTLYTPGMQLQACETERYAVVSYVQCAGGKKPPATWSSEVDAVLTALAERKIITDKAVWFDKLASRQYKDSQKWWGAAATMQFLFNPVIMLLPRMSEQQEFLAAVGQTIWGSVEADRVFGDFLEHARLCTECRATYVLQWALQQDCVLPMAALRTWPRVEHALGGSSLGLFTSDVTYVALASLLTLTFAMFSAICKNSRPLFDVLKAADVLPSCFMREDGTALMGWVHMSCSNWDCHPNMDDTTPLKEIASCMGELYHLFCKLLTPKQMDFDEMPGVNGHQMRFRSGWGLFYPESAVLQAAAGRDVSKKDAWEGIDVPTLARFNANDTCNIQGHYSFMSKGVYAFAQWYWATANIRRNWKIAERGNTRSITNGDFVVARRYALMTLVHTKAAQAPCYAWDDKLVAAILLSSPKVFLDAFEVWQDQNEGGQLLDEVTEELKKKGVLAEHEDVVWEPNTLLVALAMRPNHTVHRLVTRPPTFTSPVHVTPLRSCAPRAGEYEASQLNGFAGYFLGHLPLRTVDALRFKTKAGTELPHVNEWVYRALQDVSMADSNMIAIREPWMNSPHQLARQCWHCQKLLRAGLQLPGRSGCMPKSVQLVPSDLCMENVVWGLGSFDPLNFAALLDPDYYYGGDPDSVVVLIEYADDDRNLLHAHALAHFTLLGSNGVHACSSCHAILAEERVRGVAELLAVWTVLPITYRESGHFEAVEVI